MRNPTRIALFLSVVSIFLYIANLVVYEALALTFGITSGFGLTLLGVGLGILPASFVGMMFVGSYYYNLFTRTAYRIVAIYMSLFAYLFMASFVYGMLFYVASLFGLYVGTEPIGLVLFGGAVLTTLYGVLHARRITVARYRVTLPNLPAAWKGKKAAWISDVHLGQIYGPSFVTKVARAVNTLKPNIIFIGGDLYDGTQAPDPLLLAKPLEGLSAPWGVHYITGNHEEFGDNTLFIQAIKALGIQVLYDKIVEIEGLQLLGVDYHNAHTTEGFANILAGFSIDSTKPSVLLKHEPNHLHVAEEAGVSLQISGHTHYGQQWPFGLIAQLNYLGYAYGLKQFGKMHMLTSSGVGSWGPPVRVGSNSEIVEITFV